MKASEHSPEKMPKARYSCGNQACIRPSTWPAEALRWSPGGDDGHGAAWPPGFYCGTCQDEAPLGGVKEDAPTLAEEMARRAGVAGVCVGTANVVKMRLVGNLLCFPFDMTKEALLRVPLVDEDGKPVDWPPWNLPVWYDWPGSEFLPCDLVSVEGQIAANGEYEPLLSVSRVRLLEQDVTGEQRKRLLQCEDALERWRRARRLSRWD